MWLFALFVAVPLIEIALFIQVGGAIGLFPTLGVVIVTAILGTWLVRSQGLQELANLRNTFNELRDPTETLANGAMILFSGALLLTPGFFTDAVGFVLLVPPFRKRIFEWARKRVKVAHFEMGDGFQSPNQPRQPEDTIIEGEFEDLGHPKNPTHKPSGWTKH